ncbi:hypothetical protein Rsub_11916 [Raphidocelis subcapitata]|uniref:Myb-like domain-containing protein n=1 Tax=Raphidocelis subcapitata TaxID=307507 RepID=A0A2V0PNU2_9CHLO|nr:hypothetical protein Rsub_11916 [Raphidocelis subcapitata]|eukprot:GBF99107.1 hypothetical protein Rsub_11916 [Raphidocelis subcapitata]
MSLPLPPHHPHLYAAPALPAFGCPGALTWDAAAAAAPALPAFGCPAPSPSYTADDDPSSASAATGAAIGLDPDFLSALAAAQEGVCAGGGVPHALIGPDGEPFAALALDEADLQQQLAALAASGALASMDDCAASASGGGGGGACSGAALRLAAPLARQAADVDRSSREALRRADMQAMQAAKRAGELVTLRFRLRLPPELRDPALGEGSGIIEAPASACVAQLKRLFCYAARNSLLPALQVLFSEDGREMEETGPDGLPLPIAAYGVGEGSLVTLCIEIPDDIDALPLAEGALLASALDAAAAGGGSCPFSSSGGGGAHDGGCRKTRWTRGQIEALVEGVERHGLSAWRSIVQDPRLGGKNNMQCKDKFRNLCLTIIQGRPERGLTLDPAFKERLKVLIATQGIRY